MTPLSSLKAAALTILLASLCPSTPLHAEEATTDDAASAKPRISKARKSAKTPADTQPEDADSPGSPRLRVVHTRSKPLAAITEPAWQALAEGKLPEARADYERVLAKEPRNIDALIGLAHIHARQNQSSIAQSLVQRALEAHPRNTHAQALSLMLSGGIDSAAAQSAFKNLLESQGPIASAHFGLGNLLARDARWQEAQEAFFRAWSLDPDNADYQYNLAVSLDHLNQPALALDHYRGAQQAARARRAAFDDAQAASRIRTLSEPASPGQPDRPK